MSGDLHHRRGTHKDLLYTQSGILEKKNRNSKYRLKSEPYASLPTMDTLVTKNSKHVTSDVAMGIRIPDSVTASPCFSASAPAASNTLRVQLPSRTKNAPLYKSVSQKRLFPPDATPKRKTERSDFAVLNLDNLDTC